MNILIRGDLANGKIPQKKKVKIYRRKKDST